jgi:hypothetical protein
VKQPFLFFKLYSIDLRLYILHEGVIWGIHFQGVGIFRVSRGTFQKSAGISLQLLIKRPKRNIE